MMSHADEVMTALARERGKDLIAYAYLFTGDVPGAQDLVQEALLRVFGRMRTGFSPDVAEAYVRRTIVTLHVDRLRRARLWSDRAPMLVDDELREPPDVAGSVDLRSALTALSPQERASVVLRYYADLTVPEVARELGLAEGTVKRYLSTAVHKLGARLGPIDAVPEARVNVLPSTERRR